MSRNEMPAALATSAGVPVRSQSAICASRSLTTTVGYKPASCRRHKPSAQAQTVTTRPRVMHATLRQPGLETSEVDDAGTPPIHYNQLVRGCTARKRQTPTGVTVRFARKHDQRDVRHCL